MRGDDDDDDDDGSEYNITLYRGSGIYVCSVPCVNTTGALQTDSSLSLPKGIDRVDDDIL